MLDLGKYVPLYVRLETDIRQRISGGELTPGDPIPSEAELARQYGTSRVTVRQALARLRYDGVLESTRGRGTFVARPSLVHPLNSSRSFEEKMAAQGVRVDHKLLRFDRVAPSAEVCTTLDVRPQDRVYRLERLRIVGGKLLGLECHYIPPDIGARIEPELARTRPVLELVETVHGRQARRMRISIRAGIPTPAEARKLGLRTGVPIVVRRHAYATDQGRWILCGRNLFTERYEAILELEDRDGQIVAHAWYPTVNP